MAAYHPPGLDQVTKQQIPPSGIAERARLRRSHATANGGGADDDKHYEKADWGQSDQSSVRSKGGGGGGRAEDGGSERESGEEQEEESEWQPSGDDDEEDWLSDHGGYRGKKARSSPSWVGKGSMTSDFKGN